MLKELRWLAGSVLKELRWAVYNVAFLFLGNTHAWPRLGRVLWS